MNIVIIARVAIEARGKSSRHFRFLKSLEKPSLEDRLFDLLMRLFASMLYDLLKWVVGKLREWLRRKP